MGEMYGLNFVGVMANNPDLGISNIGSYWPNRESCRIPVNSPSSSICWRKKFSMVKHITDLKGESFRIIALFSNDHSYRNFGNIFR